MQRMEWLARLDALVVFRNLLSTPLLRALREERGGKTVVLVSHRQSTMRIADTVYSVEHGRMS